MFRKIEACNSESFRLLSALYLTSDMKTPHLEFNQVKKGIFICEHIKNVRLEISKAHINHLWGCVMYIVDLNHNTKVKSKLLQSCKEITNYDFKNKNNSVSKLNYWILEKEDFEDNSIKPDYRSFHNNSALTNFYLSATFITPGSDFEFAFTFNDNKIILRKPNTSWSITEAEETLKKKWLTDFEQKYLELYDTVYYHGNPYLNFM